MKSIRLDVCQEHNKHQHIVIALLCIALIKDSHLLVFMSDDLKLSSQRDPPNQSLLVSHIHSEREKSDLCFCSMGLIPAADKCNMIKAIKVTSWNVNGILNIVKRYKIL
ncbi:hypothetical protein F7725_002236 [Dissostichus mawsoni]|uniref:Uncharacterized protein n=1 Tax=Dissostichus mawsoni TaxID=36200 RepID=A0A7J5Y1U2_DISMA|nr:hypothetical protein F7725_002233 [Dissostichus mawsoni]KAF3843387.1 hypothetical protein F7725_002236 [Dissostichus mawsoni]